MKRALLVLLVATTAHANVWQRAITRGSPDPQQDLYDSEMKTGDELAMQANAKGASMKTVRQLVDHAVMSYRNAAQAKPNEGEPYYRIGRLLYSFYFECEDVVSFQNVSPLCYPHDITLFDRRHAAEVVEAWDAFEVRAPLDPRLSVHLGESEILFKRAILNTKLVSKDHLEAAARDYEKILARSDTGNDSADETVWSNLAETYMMLDRLEDAIDVYREAVRRGASTSTLYGLAVALDRDERAAAARDLMQSQGENALSDFHKSVIEGRTFFVPRGEEYYYFALAHEAFDQNEEAIEYWEKYIQSGAHPEFQPRAKAHLAALMAKRHGVPKAPWDSLLERPAK
jgi:tetratricopeptide (TPR) repeat protein